MFWKKKKRKTEEVEENLYEEVTGETFDDSAGTETLHETGGLVEEPESVRTAPQPEVEAAVEFREPKETEEDTGSGIILYGKKVSGFFGKGFMGILSILILPPTIVFALSILVIVFMLVFPLFAVILITVITIALVTLSISIIALPVIFPMLILFVLITDKGRLLIGSEGKWFGVELFGKIYSLK